jgi:hypothetical protein
VPTVVLGFGLIPAMLVSPVLLYAATVFFFLAARRFLSARTSLCVSAVHALYYPYWRSIEGLWSEPLAVFLVCGMCGVSSMVFLSPKERPIRRYPFILALFLGYLSLTKPLFGYEITVLILASAIGFLLARSVFWKESVFVCLGAAVVALPYLGWTYTMTGRLFYWGSSGGSSLYFMSTGSEGEYGSWMPTHRIAAGAKGYFAAVEQNHYKLFDQWDGLTEVERDEKLKQTAINNIRNRPLIYAKNIFCNACRVFLDFPYSYEYQRPTTVFYILPNMLLLVGGMLSAVLSVFCGAHPPPWLTWVGMLGAIYFGGTLLLSAYPRMLFPLVPILILWEAYVLNSCVSLRSAKEQ